MKIGERVKAHTRAIFDYCDTVEPDEFDRLLDLNYSKRTFRINYPFCAEVSKSVSREQSKRYWTPEYTVRGKRVRVSSQRLITSEPNFLWYLATKGIVSGVDAL